MKALREIIVTIIIAVAIFFLLQTTIQSSVVIGASMEPSLQHRQRLLISKVVYSFQEPGRGDVVVFHMPNNWRTEFIKRIIALPGDTVKIKAGTVYVNDTQLSEPYIADPPGYTFNEQVVPADNYFVLGDNRNNSNDSHKGWTVPRHNIVGRAWLSIWPPGEWGLAPNYPLQEQLAGSMNEQPTVLIRGPIWQLK